MRQALELAESLGLDLPALRENRKLWERVAEAGLGELDHSAVYVFLGGRPPGGRSGFGAAL
jgi:3-hydroxyisobutyrate dehydrogenase-like beta-hydroxyacid dehydrogenase